MTRINTVPPENLTDQHLMAEYRELPMVMASLKRSAASHNGIPQPASQYTLNKGHVTFFYDKGAFLKRRYDALVRELAVRGYSLDAERKADFSIFKQLNRYNDWQPTQNDHAVNAARIVERINAKPDWYRFHGSPITSLSLDKQQLLFSPHKNT